MAPDVVTFVDDGISGLHVWLEKPVGTSVADVDSMIAARGNRIAAVGYSPPHHLDPDAVELDE